MIAHGLRRGICAAVAAGLLLGGCNMVQGWLGIRTEPDELAAWAAKKGVVQPGLLGTFKAGESVRSSADGHGFQFPTENGAPATRLYYVPVAAFGDDMEAKLRRAVFPSGIATLEPTEDNKPPRQVAETEVENFFFEVMVFEKSALCDDLTKPCDAAGAITIAGKFKGAPLMGKGARRLEIDPAERGSGTLTASKLSRPADACGFDSERDRLPHHIAVSCDRIRLMDWALHNGFTVDSAGKLLPLTPDALSALVDAMVIASLYVDGHLLGRLQDAN